MTRLEVGPIDVKPDPWQRLVATGSILSVLFVAIGLYITNEANRETSEANREQHRLTAQGQITDRFTKAVEQLGQPGAEKVDVRLGAIYALERIMRDSAVDQPAIVDILAAFIRVHAPAPTRTTAPPSSASRPPVDIQAVVTVLGRRDITRDGTIGNETLPIRRLDLSDINLAHANLAYANLNGANLDGTELARATLIEASLTGTNLSDANLSRAVLHNTRLAGAILTDANLTQAFLFGADLTRANLTRANLNQAFLNGTNLKGRVSARTANAVANLTANLAYADLTDAVLTGADLTGADLTGANLTGANLTGANLTCAKTDDRTLWPTGMPRPVPCDD
ncbi:pentapeptide repeat-containing protein [Micromonospora echinofusca]|uniref:pentapeptide repeat-containing protein n=1 Tax=Micromonospora echinofusca TaxID=47858 RepID=UPI00341443AB